ncbi:hypothetical protein ABPG72_009836 [Tetrahymena utriculariae]
MRFNLFITLVIAGFAITHAQNVRGFQENQTATQDMSFNTTHVNLNDFIGNSTKDSFNNTFNSTTFTNSTSISFNFTETRNSTYKKNNTSEFNFYSNGTYNYTSYTQPTNSSYGFANTSASAYNYTAGWNYPNSTNSSSQYFNSSSYYNYTLQGRANNSNPNNPYYYGNYSYNPSDNRTNYTSQSYGHPNSSYENYGVGSGYGNSGYSNNTSEYHYEYQYDFDDQFLGYYLIGGIFRLIIAVAFFYVMAKWWKNRQERLSYLRQAQIPLTHQQIPQNYYQIQNPQFQYHQVPQQHQQQVAYQQTYLNQGHNMVAQAQPQFINNPIPQVQQVLPIQPNQYSSFEIQQGQRQAYPSLKPQN